MSNATCQMNGKLVLPCLGLLETAEDRHKKGLVRIDITSPRDGFKPTRNIYAIKNGSHSKNGLVMLYCPFCGENIYPESNSGLDTETKHADN